MRLANILLRQVRAKESVIRTLMVKAMRAANFRQLCGETTESLSEVPYRFVYFVFLSAVSGCFVLLRFYALVYHCLCGPCCAAMTPQVQQYGRDLCSGCLGCTKHSSMQNGHDTPLCQAAQGGSGSTLCVLQV